MGCLALVPGVQQGGACLRIVGDRGRLDETRVGEEAGHPFLAAADLQSAPVLGLVPVGGQAVFVERRVERRQVPVPFGVRKDAIAIEDQGRHQARPELPKVRMCSRAISFTAAVWTLNNDGGSHLSFPSAPRRNSRPDFM